LLTEFVAHGESAYPARSGPAFGSTKVQQSGEMGSDYGELQRILRLFTPYEERL
jgi:hypothetical protein